VDDEIEEFDGGKGVVDLMVFSEGCVFEKGPFLGFWQSPGGNTEKAEV
jgi:hypothetical protein